MMLTRAHKDAYKQQLEIALSYPATPDSTPEGTLEEKIAKAGMGMEMRMRRVEQLGVLVGRRRLLVESWRTIAELWKAFAQESGPHQVMKLHAQLMSRDAEMRVLQMELQMIPERKVRDEVQRIAQSIGVEKRDSWGTLQAFVQCEGVAGFPAALPEYV